LRRSINRKSRYSSFYIQRRSTDPDGCLKKLIEKDLEAIHWIASSPWPSISEEREKRPYKSSVGTCKSLEAFSEISPRILRMLAMTKRKKGDRCVVGKHDEMN